MPRVRRGQSGRIVGRLDRGEHQRSGLLRVQSQQQRHRQRLQVAGEKRNDRARRLVRTRRDGHPSRRAGVHFEHGDRGPGNGAAGGHRGHSQSPLYRCRVEQAHRRPAVQRDTLVGQQVGDHGQPVPEQIRQISLSEGVRTPVQSLFRRVQNQMAHRERRPGDRRARSGQLLLRHGRFVAGVEFHRRNERCESIFAANIFPVSVVSRFGRTT